MKETVDFNWPNEKKGVKPEIMTLPLFLLSNTINGNKLEFFFFFFGPPFPVFYCLDTGMMGAGTQTPRR